MSVESYDSSIIACRKLLKETFRSHDGIFSDEQINSASAVLCGEMDLDKISYFVAVTHMGTSMGRYAFDNHAKVTEAIYKRDWSALRDQYLKGSEVIPEVYLNDILSQKEKNVIISQVEVDKNTIISMIKNYRDTKCQEGKLMMPCETNRVSILSGKATYYHKCKETICLADGGYPDSPLPMGGIHLVDKEDESDKNSNSFQCYSLDSIIELLAKNSGDIYNPSTSKPFPRYTMESLRNKYRKEIAIYKYAIRSIKEDTKQ